MPLQIIAGPGGAGKSHRVYEQLIRESAAHPEKSFYVLVPEQFTLETQKDLAAMHPSGGLFNIDVLSFNRLAWRVFQKTGGAGHPVLEESGKNLVIRRVAEEKKKDLQVLGGALNKPGAVSGMKSLLSELMQYRFSPEDLDSWLEEGDGRELLARKLRDVRTIYRGYCDYLEERYLTAEEVPEILCRKLDETDILNGSTVLLNGFTGFTPVQYEVLRKFFSLCEQVILVVTADPGTDLLRRSSVRDLFFMSRQMVQKAAELAADARFGVLPVQWIDESRPERQAEKDLVFLERNLFRYSGRTYREAPEAIRILELPDPEKEVDRVAAEIRHLVRDCGCAYRNIAVVAGDLSVYGRMAERIFTREKIPYFLDQKRPVLASPLAEAIRALLRIPEENYSYESVFGYLRSGFSGISAGETDRMENYVLAMGIRGKKQYQERWIRRRAQDTEEDLEVLDALRARIYAELAPFCARMKQRGGTVRDKVTALYTFLMDRRVPQQLEERAERCRAEGREADAREYEQVFPVILGLFDKCVEILGEEKIGFSSFVQVLEAGLEECSVGLIPPGLDQVQIGNLGRTRLTHVRYLFLIGVNDGIIPQRISGKGILSEPDREFLEKKQVKLSPGAREAMDEQRFYLYLTMTKPSGRLYLSYCRTDAKGEAQLPSYLIGTLMRMYPHMKVRTEVEENLALPLRQLETKAGRDQLVLETLREGKAETVSPVFGSLWNRMEASADGREEKRLFLQAILTRNTGSSIGRAAAEAVYGKTLVNSATRLEQFAACAYAHFLQYGLRLKEREVYTFKPSDLGMVMHEALERFTEKLFAEGRSWSALSDEDRRRLADEALDEVVHGYGNTILHSTMRNTWLISRIGRTLQRTVWALQKQLQHGEFVPAAAEASFSGTAQTAHLSIRDGVTMRLVGRIDRIDCCRKDGRCYLKVVDYKTGGTKLDLQQLYEGLQLQLFVYLNAAVEAWQKRFPEEKVEAAGVFYYHIDDPLTETAGMTPKEDREEALLEQLKPDGLCRAEEEILRLMDREIVPGMSSKVLPVTLKKDGTLSERANAAGGSAFSVLRKFVQKKAALLAEGIMEGETEIRPCQNGEKSACTYCPYRSVCGFDDRIPGYEKRRIKKESREEILRKMQEEE